MMAGLPEIQRRILGGEKMEMLMKEVEKMDQEWKDLILSALKMGISKEEIREFLKTQTLKN
jgi:DNA-binding transcriptional regulator YhcF (GntR family)